MLWKGEPVLGIGLTDLKQRKRNENENKDKLRLKLKILKLRSKKIKNYNQYVEPEGGEVL